MITICSQCKRVIAQTLHGGGGSSGDVDEPVSHGICTQCLVILENEIREKPDLSLALPRETENSLKVKNHG